VERDAFLQLEGVRQAVVADLPALGEAGRELCRAGLQADQRLEDLVDHAQRLAVGDERAVEDDGILRRAEDERAAACGSLASRRGAGISAALIVVPTAAGCDKRERQHGQQEQEPQRLSLQNCLLSQGIAPERQIRGRQYPRPVGRGQARRAAVTEEQQIRRRAEVGFRRG
jgi:hypothetical protein